MRCNTGPSEFAAESHYLALHLKDRNDLVQYPQALRPRLREAGYLLIRDVHDRDEVLQARHH